MTNPTLSLTTITQYGHNTRQGQKVSAGPGTREGGSEACTHLLWEKVELITSDIRKPDQNNSTTLLPSRQGSVIASRVIVSPLLFQENRRKRGGWRKGCEFAHVSGSSMSHYCNPESQGYTVVIYKGCISSRF